MSIHRGLESRNEPRVGQFTVLLDSTSANIWRNYAVPDADAEPSAQDVATLIAYFHEKGRVPRLEYVPSAAPAVESALIAAGFEVEGRPPLMGCRACQLTAKPIATGASIVAVTEFDDLFDTARVQDIAYAETEPTGPESAARLRSWVDRGGVVVLARDSMTGAAVGGGQVSAAADGVSELAAVGVVESHRRRGIATAVVAALTEAALDRGAEIVWLEPAGKREQAIYERAGFTCDGEKLWISRPASARRARPLDFDHAAS